MTTVPNAKMQRKLVEAVESYFKTEAQINRKREEMHKARDEFLHEFLRPDPEEDPPPTLSMLSSAYQEVAKLEPRKLDDWRLLKALACCGHDLAKSTLAATNLDTRTSHLEEVKHRMLEDAQEVGIWQGRLEAASIQADDER